MFRATMCPSSGETTVFMWHLVLVTVWMSVWYAGAYAPAYQSSIQKNKNQVSHKYSCFSWWWAHSPPKHVQKRNKHTKKNCVPSWLHLQEASLLFTHDITCTLCFYIKTKDDTENSHLMDLHLPVPQFFANIWLNIFQDSHLKVAWHFNCLNIQILLWHTVTYGGYVSEENSNYNNQIIRA